METPDEILQRFTRIPVLVQLEIGVSLGFISEAEMRRSDGAQLYNSVLEITKGNKKRAKKLAIAMLERGF